MVIQKKLEKNIKNWTPVNERIITVEMKGPGNIAYCIIGVYAPTDDATVEVKDDFFDKLTEVLDNVGQRKS